jgi:hypothetical protein
MILPRSLGSNAKQTENLTESITVRFSAFLEYHLICFDFISIDSKSVNKIKSSTLLTEWSSKILVHS